MRVPSIILLGLSGLLAGPTLAQGRSHEGVVSAALQSEDPAAALEAIRGTIPPEAPLNLIDAGFLVVGDQPGPQVTSGQVELLTAHLMMTEAGRVAASLRRPTD